MADRPQSAVLESDAAPSAARVESLTVFRAFDVDDFLEWPAWRRLLRILRTNGGSYGLAGARGSGKSWLMLRAIAWVRDAPDTGRLGGIGLWYPTPSEYNPLAFLASLSDGLGTEIDRWYRRSPRVAAVRSLEFAISASIALAAGTGALILLIPPIGNIPLRWALVIATAVIVGVAIRWLLRSQSLFLAREARLAAEARLVRERARFTATRRETTELSADGGRAGVRAGLRRARERELVERPATLSSLVNDFRALAEEAGEVAGRVVIAIDELDKMADADGVRALLRDIKGIFEVPRVHFLVSVSDEAARSLSLGALEGRNEFNSSFYTVLEAEPASPQELAELVEGRSRRAIPSDVGLTLAVLSGGNPRELLRLTELAGGAESGVEAAIFALEDEALRLRREVVTAPDVDGLPGVSEGARVGVFTSLPDKAFDDREGFVSLAGHALELWSPGFAQQQGDGFAPRFGEAWQRLMLRLMVANELVSADAVIRDPGRALQLRDVIVAASQSAAVGRVVFERDLRTESPRASGGREAARDRLDRIGRTYEMTREAKMPGIERTRDLDELMVAARASVAEAEFDDDELAEMLDSPSPTGRIIGLATIEVTGNPAHLNRVLAIALDPATAFEGYQALRALEAEVGGVDEDERTRIRDLLADGMPRLDADSNRFLIADRIVRRIESESGAPGSAS